MNNISELVKIVCKSDFSVHKVILELAMLACLHLSMTAFTLQQWNA